MVQVLQEMDQVKEAQNEKDLYNESLSLVSQVSQSDKVTQISLKGD